MSASADGLILRDVAFRDISRLQEIYAYHVLNGTASFEEAPPGADEMALRWSKIVELGLPYILAEREGKILGYAYAGPYRPRTAYRFVVEDSIYIDPAHTGHGLGRLLLSELIACCTKLGKRQMLAIIGDSANHASIGLHQSMGFTLTGTFRSIGFKFGRWLDSVLMQRSLGEGDLISPIEENVKDSLTNRR